MAFNSSAFLQARQAGANALAGGITSAAGSIVKSIENHQSEAKRLKAFRAMAVDGLGMDAEEVDALDADTLQGKLQAVAVQSEMEKLQREQEDQAFQEAQRAAGQRFQQQLAPLAPGMSGPEQPLTPQRMMAAAADSGYQLDPRVFAQFAKEGDESANGFKFDPSQIVDLEQFGLPGQVYTPTSKGGGQIRTRFDAGNGGIEEVADEEGNVFKFMTNPKTGARTILSRPKAAPTLPTGAQNALTEGLTALQNDLQQLSQSDSQIQALFPGLTPAKVRATTESRLKSKRAEMKAVIDLQHKLGSVNNELRDSLYADYGITASKPARQTVTTKAQFDALPKGAIYTGKDGKQYRKP